MFSVNGALMVEIKGFLETSFLDWRGRMCGVMFLSGCNLRCPFCHNHPLVQSPESLDSLDFDALRIKLASLKKWLEGVCISGGEPTLDPNLPAKIQQLKKDGWAIKLDTNGTRPRVLAQLLADGLVDMIAMDVKAPLQQDKYDQCAGIHVNLDTIKSSIAIIKNSGVDHEFRMTVVPRFHSEVDIINWASFLGDDSHLTLQNFNPQSTMDPSLSTDKGFPPEIFSRYREMISRLGIWH